MKANILEISGIRLESRLLKEGFVHPDGPIACTSKCCAHGVYLDPQERDRILSYSNLIKKYIDASQTDNVDSWFDNMEEEDQDFPSGKCVSTMIYNGKCVFLDSKGRCVLQITEKEEGLGKFTLKPYYCVLFPITKSNGVFEYDNLCEGECDCCTATSQSDRNMVEICQTEFEYAIGKEKYNEMLLKLKGFSENGKFGK
ncbi:MAG: DUF3109 family protein [Candidatus Kryptoniota bacterium]